MSKKPEQGRFADKNVKKVCWFSGIKYNECSSDSRTVWTGLVNGISLFSLGDGFPTPGIIMSSVRNCWLHITEHYPSSYYTHNSPFCHLFRMRLDVKSKQIYSPLTICCKVSWQVENWLSPLSVQVLINRFDPNNFL